jgi:hypothetical protein
VALRVATLNAKLFSRSARWPSRQTPVLLVVEDVIRAGGGSIRATRRPTSIWRSERFPVIDGAGRRFRALPATSWRS